jgi:hypothetical protein
VPVNRILSLLSASFPIPALLLQLLPSWSLPRHLMRATHMPHLSSCPLRPHKRTITLTNPPWRMLSDKWCNELLTQTVGYLDVLMKCAWLSLYQQLAIQEEHLPFSFMYHSYSHRAGILDSVFHWLLLLLRFYHGTIINLKVHACFSVAPILFVHNVFFIITKRGERYNANDYIGCK